MRTSADPLPVQVWARIGLNAWESAILRREVERLATNPEYHVRTQRGHKLPLTLQWTDAESCQSLVTKQDFVQVMIVDRTVTEKNLEAFFESMGTGSSATVRLLWDWRHLGRTSVDWATELGFAGVIFDFLSLRDWSRIAFAKCSFHECELHPILAKLNTPCLRG